MKYKFVDIVVAPNSRKKKKSLFVANRNPREFSSVNYV